MTIYRIVILAIMIPFLIACLAAVPMSFIQFGIMHGMVWTLLTAAAMTSVYAATVKPELL